MADPTAYAALRARLERKHDELVAALKALSKTGAVAKPGGLSDNLFRLLGVVTFWQACDEPSEAMIAQVNQAMDMLTIEVRRG